MPIPARNAIGLPMERVAKRELVGLSHHFHIHADEISSKTFVELCIYIFEIYINNYSMQCDKELAQQQINKFKYEYSQYMNEPFRDVNPDILRDIFNEFVDIYQLMGGIVSISRIEDELSN